MTLIKPGLTRHRAIHGHLGQLSELLQRSAGLRHERAHAGPDDRLLGIEEQPHGVFDIARRRRLRHTLGGQVVHGRVGHLLRAHVGRDFNGHGSRTAIAQAVERPPHHAGGHIRLPQDFAVHGDGLIRVRRGKVRTH